MIWQIKIHPLVVHEDFKTIVSFQQKTILQAIQKKLSLDPHNYGKPLSGEFQGYWRLRVGDYRVVYRIIKEQIVVLVIKIGIRKDDQVYQELFSRLRKLRKHND